MTNNKGGVSVEAPIPFAMLWLEKPLVTPRNANRGMSLIFCEIFSSL